MSLSRPSKVSITTGIFQYTALSLAGSATLQRDQRIAHHAHAVGVGENDRAGQQARFAHPFQAGGVAVAVQHVHAGKAGAWRAEPGRGSITVTPVRTLRPSAKSA